MKKHVMLLSITAIFVLAVFGTVTTSNTLLNPNLQSVAYAALPEAEVDFVEHVSPVKTKYHVGDVLTFTIKATNTGPDTATMVNVTDGIWQGMEFVSASGSGSYNSKTRTITWHLSNLKKGESKTVSFKAKILKSAAGTEMDNKAELWVAEFPYHIDANIIWIDVAKASISSDNNSSATTIPLQPTGISVAGLVLGILAVFGGLATSKKF